MNLNFPILLAVALFFLPSCEKRDAVEKSTRQTELEKIEDFSIAAVDGEPPIPKDVILLIKNFHQSRFVFRDDSIYYKIYENASESIIRQLKGSGIEPRLYRDDISETDKLNGVSERFHFYYYFTGKKLHVSIRDYKKASWDNWEEAIPAGSGIPALSNSFYIITRKNEKLLMQPFQNHAVVLPEIKAADLTSFKQE